MHHVVTNEMLSKGAREVQALQVSRTLLSYAQMNNEISIHQVILLKSCATCNGIYGLIHRFTCCSFADADCEGWLKNVRKPALNADTNKPVQ